MREVKEEAYGHFYRAYLKSEAMKGLNGRLEWGGAARPEPPQPKPKRPPHPYLYYNQFKPLLIVLRLFGRYPIRVDSQGEYRSDWISFWGAYCLTSYLLQTYLAVIVCFRRVQALVDSQRDYDEFIFSIHILAYLNIHFHVPFTFWLQAPRLEHYLRIWATFQEDWTATYGAPFELAYRRTVRVFIGLVIPLIFLFLVFEQYATLQDPILYFLPYFFTLVSTALVLGLWFCTCLEIRRLAASLSRNLAQEVEGGPRRGQLWRWRLLWLQLRGISESLGDDLCAVLASIMLTFSTTFLLGFYNGLVQLISSGPSWKALGYLAASSSSLLQIFVICDGGQRATSDIVSNTLTSLLKGKLSIPNQELRHEVYFVLETIKADPPEIRLGGFVTLNRPLVISFISNSLTYLIVLLQFKVNEEEQEEKLEEIPFENTTTIL